MSHSIVKEVGRFTGQDEDGNIFEIVESQEFHDATSVGSTAQEWIAGMKSYETSTGQVLNMVDDNTFELVGPGKKLTRV